MIDGASTDGTREVLERYRARIPVFVSEPGGGIYDAPNKGIRHSHGDVIGFMQADDMFAHADTLRPDQVMESCVDKYSAQPSKIGRR